MKTSALNFIARNIQVIGLFLLTASVAAAACLYWDIPGRWTASTAVRPATQYSCPMHPNIVSDRAGDCPRCGMALVAANVAAEEHAGCAHSGGGCCGKAEPPAKTTASQGCPYLDQMPKDTR